jgi:hypothetical protein
MMRAIKTFRFSLSVYLRFNLSNGVMEQWSVGPLFQHSITPLPLPLPLFVPFVAANDPNDAFAPDDLAILTKLFYGCANFHS